MEALFQKMRLKFVSMIPKRILDFIQIIVLVENPYRLYFSNKH